MNFKFHEVSDAETLFKDCDVWNKREHFLEVLAGDFLLFGAGYLGERTVRLLANVGIRPAGLVDNHRREQIDGYEVLGAQEAIERYGKDTPIFITIWQGGVQHFDSNTCKGNFSILAQRMFSVL